MPNVIVFGASGATGQKLVNALLANDQIQTITLINRHLLSQFTHTQKIKQHLTDNLSQLENLDATEIQTAYICLGTTIKKAGSKEAFEAIDRDLVVSIARWTQSEKIQSLHVISSAGANCNSKSHYLKIKGEMESTLKSLAIPSLFIYRPSLLYAANRPEKRIGEIAGYYALKLATSITTSFKGHQPISVDQLVATMMLYSSATDPQGNVTINSSTILERGLELDTYFHSEANFGKGLSLVGLTGITLALLTYSLTQNTLINAMLLPTVVLSLLIIIVGGPIWLRTHGQLTRLRQLKIQNQRSFIEQERVRINTVIRRMNGILYFEFFILFILGLIAAISPLGPEVTGIGLGAAMMSIMIMPIDLFIKLNAVDYRQWLLQFQRIALPEIEIKSE